VVADAFAGPAWLAQLAKHARRYISQPRLPFENFRSDHREKQRQANRGFIRIPVIVAGQRLCNPRTTAMAPLRHFPHRFQPY
jgi:hypothetical protein